MSLAAACGFCPLYFCCAHPRRDWLHPPCSPFQRAGDYYQNPLSGLNKSGSFSLSVAVLDQHLNHHGHPSLNSQFILLFCWRWHKTDTVLQMQVSNSLMKGNIHLPQSAATFLVMQLTLQPLSLQGKQLTHVQPAGCQGFFCKASAQPVCPQSGLMHGVIPCQVQEFPLVITAPHGVLASTFLQPAEVLLKGSPAALGHISLM